LSSVSLAKKKGKGEKKKEEGGEKRGLTYTLSHHFTPYPVDRRRLFRKQKEKKKGKKKKGEKGGGKKSRIDTS